MSVNNVLSNNLPSSTNLDSNSDNAKRNELKVALARLYGDFILSLVVTDDQVATESPIQSQLP
jgi:hypothetical protein